LSVLDDSDEEQEENEEMALTCVFVGEYLCSEKEERPTFYARNRMEWERHISELTAEGTDAQRCNKIQSDG